VDFSIYLIYQTEINQARLDVLGYQS